VPPLEETVARIESVNSAALTAYAGRLAGQGAAALALYGPAEAAPPLSELRERLAA
jgi:hypothetical protein